MSLSNNEVARFPIEIGERPLAVIKLATRRGSEVGQELTPVTCYQTKFSEP